MSDANFNAKVSMTADLKQFVKEVSTSFDKALKACSTFAKGVSKLGDDKLSSSVQNMVGSLSSLKDKFSELGKAQEATAKSGTLLERTFENKVRIFKAVAQAAKELEAEIKKGNITETEAQTALKSYQKGFDGLVQQMNLAKVGTDALNTSITRSQLLQLQTSGALKITASGFKIYKQAAIDALLTTEASRKSMGEWVFGTTLFKKAVVEAGQYTDAYGRALQKLGRDYGKNNGEAEVYIKKLKEVEKALEALRVKQVEETQDVNGGDWVKGLDRANIVMGIFGGNIVKINGQLKALNKEGMAALGQTSADSAKKVGILDKSFYELENKLLAFQKVTGESKENIKLMRDQLIASTKNFHEAAVEVDKYIKSAVGNDKIKKEISLLVLKYKELFATETSQRTAALALMKTYQETGKDVEQLKIKLRDLNAEVIKEQKENSKLGITLRETSVKYRELFQSGTKYGEAAKRLYDAMKTGNYDTAKLLPVFKRLDAQWKESAKAATGLAGAVDYVARSFKVYARYMIASGSLRGFMTGFQNAAKEMIAYDQALHNLKAILNATNTEVDMMGTKLLEVAVRTKFSITETSEAMQLLGQAGFTAMESIQMIDAVSDLATGTLEDLKETVKLVTSAITVFNMDSSEASKVADIFANAVNYSRLTIEMMNTAFNYIGPVAEEAELSIRDVSAALMLMSNAGVRASTSATGFRRVLGVLENPTEAFKKSVIDAGYSLEEFDTRTHSLGEIISKLPDVVNTAGEAIKMFGLRGSAVITAFTGKSNGEFERLKATLDETGAASRMAAEQMEGLGTAWKNIMDRAGVLITVIGESGLTGIIRVFTFALKDLMGALIVIAGNPIGKVIIGLATLTAGVFAAMTAFRVFMIIFGNSNFFTALSLAIEATAESFARLPANVLKGSAALKAFELSSNSTFLTLTKGIKAISFEIQAFMATNPVGFWITVITIAIGSLLVAMSSTRKSTKELAEEIATFSTNIGSAEAAIKSYKEAIDEFGAFSKQGKEATKTLEDAVRKLGESGELSAAEVAAFISSIDRGTGTIVNQEQAIEKLSATISDKYITSISALIKEQEFAARTDTGWIYGLVDMFNDLVYAGKKLTGFYHSTLVYSQKLKKQFGFEIPISIYKTIGAFVDLQERVKSGSASESEKTVFETISKAAEKATNEILTGVDATELLSEDLEKLARQKFPDGSEMLIGAVVHNLELMRQQAILSKNAFSGILKEVQKFSSKSSNSFQEVVANMADAYDKIQSEGKTLIEAAFGDPQKIAQIQHDMEEALWALKNRFTEKIGSADDAKKRLEEEFAVLDEALVDKLRELESRPVPEIPFAKMTLDIEKGEAKITAIAYKMKKLTAEMIQYKPDSDDYKKLQHELVALQDSALDIATEFKKMGNSVEESFRDIHAEAVNSTRSMQEAISDLQQNALEQEEKWEKKWADAKEKAADKVVSAQERLEDAYDRRAEAARQVAEADEGSAASARRELAKANADVDKQRKNVLRASKEEKESLRDLQAERLKEAESQKFVYNEALKYSEEAKKALEAYSKEQTEANKKEFEYYMGKAVESFKEYGKAGGDAGKIAQKGITDLFPLTAKLETIQTDAAKEMQKGYEEAYDKAIKDIDIFRGELAKLRAESYAKIVVDKTDVDLAVVAVDKLIKKYRELNDIKPPKTSSDKPGGGGSDDNPQTYNKGQAEGGRVYHAAGGLRFPGNSTVDRVKVIARPGEGFVKNEALAVWDKVFGKKFFNGIMNPWGKDGKAIMSGLSKSTSASALTNAVKKLSQAGMNLTDMGNLNITIGNSGPFPVMVQPDIASGLKAALLREQSLRANI